MVFDGGGKLGGVLKMKFQQRHLRYFSQSAYVETDQTQQSDIQFTPETFARVSHVRKIAFCMDINVVWAV